MSKEQGKHPLLNKRAGDGLPSLAKGRKKKTKDSGSGRLTLINKALLAGQ